MKNTQDEFQVYYFKLDKSEKHWPMKLKYIFEKINLTAKFSFVKFECIT